MVFSYQVCNRIIFFSTFYKLKLPQTVKLILLLPCRAVGKYLQTIFDKEAENGKNVVVVADKLLAGKTRKEASRMFFETLVCVHNTIIEEQVWSCSHFLQTLDQNLVSFLLPNFLQVLKTRDYIQVEQAKPYESIIIKPRPKLTKSIF